MTAPEPSFRLRSPRWVRGWLVLFPLVLAAVLLGPVPLGGDAPVLLRVLLLGLGVAFSARLWHVGVDGRPDGLLVVRNQLLTRTLRKEQISGTTIQWGSGSWAVVLQLADGSREPLDVTRRPLRRWFGRSLQRELALVQRWLDTR